MRNRLLEMLNKKHTLLLDGATGTNLFSMGLQSGDAPELWNLDYPIRIANHYKSFINAGSDIVLTNSFGANRYRLQLHKLETKVKELNFQAAKILKTEAQVSKKEVIVAGAMGPTGEIFEPTGTLSIDDGVLAFQEQAIALEQGGADVIWIETLSSIEECFAAVEGASITKLPIVLTLSIETNGRTMMGLTPSDIIKMCSEMKTPIFAIGTNCGVGAADVIAAIMNMKNAADVINFEPILIAKANCGIPEWKNGEICYDGSPELMAKYSRLAMDAGARIIGGCCGTTPKHIEAMRDAIDKNSTKQRPSISTIESELGRITSGAKAQLGGDLSIEGGVKGSGNRAVRKRRNRGRN